MVLASSEKFFILSFKARKQFTSEPMEPLPLRQQRPTLLALQALHELPLEVAELPGCATTEREADWKSNVESERAP